jgi:hypothetical protein
MVAVVLYSATARRRLGFLTARYGKKNNTPFSEAEISSHRNPSVRLSGSIRLQLLPKNYRGLKNSTILAQSDARCQKALQI